MTKKKLSATETRALAYCNYIRNNGITTITVEWSKSKMWGMNPQIWFNDERCCKVSGCGYDKLSTALADVLRFLGKTEEEQQRIHRTGGAGEREVIRVLAELGWDLKPLAAGKAFDCYQIQCRSEGEVDRLADLRT